MPDNQEVEPKKRKRKSGHGGKRDGAGRKAITRMVSITSVRKPRATIDPFLGRDAAQDWARSRLSKDLADMDFLTAQLQADIASDTKACNQLVKKRIGIPTEWTRSRHQLLGNYARILSMRVQMTMDLMKQKNLLDNLGDDAAGGDTSVIVHREPPPGSIAKPRQPAEGDDGPPDE